MADCPWEEDTDLHDNVRIYAEDILCDLCDRWSIPVAHDEQNEIYCVNCLEQVADLSRWLSIKLWAGDKIIYDSKNNIDKVWETKRENEQAEEERIAYMESWKGYNARFKWKNNKNL